MRGRRLISGVQHASVGGLLVMWLICLPVAAFVVQLVEDVPVRGARVVAAAFDLHGERGTVTIVESREVREGGGRGGSHMATHCFGVFTPSDGDPPLPDTRVHVGGCEEGKVVDARLIREDLSSWVMPNEQDEAYTFGHGWGTPLLLFLFMGAFLLLAGGPFVLCAILFPIMITTTLIHRARTDATASADVTDTRGG
ncbi:hypothetical protein [Streptomyces profundus]|uniref:hypothetical protein n=1 Tax=Streptomyces profundus TaxID=2867410 RepID=UPI001D16A52E|nr:hypothetical protein [Streptomyces sp. MA3_2.13]UED87188.1 hypothetical protein K4G22_25735 [Streptomyces sp. MA3_2.13]